MKSSDNLITISDRFTIIPRKEEACYTVPKSDWQHLYEMVEDIRPPQVFWFSIGSALLGIAGAAALTAFVCAIVWIWVICGTTLASGVFSILLAIERNKTIYQSKNNVLNEMKRIEDKHDMEIISAVRELRKQADSQKYKKPPVIESHTNIISQKIDVPQSLKNKLFNYRLRPALYVTIYAIIYEKIITSKEIDAYFEKNCVAYRHDRAIKQLLMDGLLTGNHEQFTIIGSYKDKLESWILYNNNLLKEIIETYKHPEIFASSSSRDSYLMILTNQLQY